jgi:hypothetical protein
MGLEQLSRELGLTDDGLKRADAQFFVGVAHSSVS